MKSMKKLLALALVLVMLTALSVTALAAATASAGSGPASITISLPEDNAGTDQQITYHIYKVFDATQSGSAISYKIDTNNGDLSAAMTAAGFLVDDAGNVHYGTFTEAEDGIYSVGGKIGNITPKDELDEAAIAAIAAYAQDEIGTGFTAKPSDETLKITGLAYGYYYISTTVGTTVTVDSTNPDAEVQDKNTIPKPPVKIIGKDFEESVDESGKKAIEQVGTTVPFEVTIEVVKGATNYVFHDVMSDGLTYDPTSLSVDPAASVDNTTTATGDTVTVTFKNDWLAANEGKTITITYSATINDDALTVDYVNNTATLDYGDGHTTDKDEVDLYTAKITVSKEDGDGEALEGAGFVIKNEDGKYYTYDEDKGVVWVDKIEDADEHISDKDGAVAPFEGLADGTYTLVEKTVPEGYNKAADKDFTIEEGNYDAGNLEQEATVVNEAGTVLPDTGGIGTTLFYVLGTLMVLGAGVVLVTKRRVQE